MNDDVKLIYGHLEWLRTSLTTKKGKSIDGTSLEWPIFYYSLHQGGSLILNFKVTNYLSIMMRFNLDW